MTREGFYDRMDSDPELPTTSQPSPADFEAVYRQLADEGCQEIVSIHLSGRLSGTAETARLVGRGAPVPVLVVDSRSTTMGLGFQVRALARLREQGEFPTRAIAQIEHLRDAQQLYFSPRSLDNLIKGGRVGRAAGAAAGLLDIKVLISVDDEGGAFVAGKAKGTRKALGSIVERALELDRQAGPLEVSFIHIRNEEGARQLERLFVDRGVHMAGTEYHQVCPVVAVHAGIGAVGAVFQPVGIVSAKTRSGLFR